MPSETLDVERVICKRMILFWLGEIFDRTCEQRSLKEGEKWMGGLWHRAFSQMRTTTIDLFLFNVCSNGFLGNSSDRDSEDVRCCRLV